MTEGRGGTWNRAARRSGGNRPVALDVVLPFLCGHCGAELFPGLLEWRLFPQHHIEAGCCPVCKYVVTERPTRDT